jgi:DNA-directed RNA polymerase specialized sigma subunit
MEIDEIPNFDNLSDSEIDKLIEELKELKEKKNKEKKEGPEIKEKYLTVKEVAAILGVSVDTVYNLVRDRKKR